MIAILDYESAQTQALHETLSRIGVDHERVDSLDKLDRAARIILPAGGSFAEMIRDIRDNGYLPGLFRAMGQGRPILGISEGMHLLFDVSYENGQHTGLGFIPGKVTQLPLTGFGPARTGRATGSKPVTWNRPSPLHSGIKSGELFYFEHDSAVEPLDATVSLGESTDALHFTAVVEDGNVYGTQFLPERSGPAGERLLSNFVNLRLR